MITTLKEKDGKLYCVNCRIGVENLRESAYCKFCGYEWANWELMMEKLYLEIWANEDLTLE